MDKPTIAVFMGGSSSEREISIKTGTAVIAQLEKLGYGTVTVGVDGDIYEDALAKKYDRAFIALHGGDGEDGTIQQFLEEKGIPYTGSGPAACRLAMDKSVAKEIFLSHGISTPQYICVQRGDPVMEITARLKCFTYPVVVKPRFEGSSIGMTIVTEESGLQHALDTAWNYDQYILIERYISGDEVTAGILNGEALPLIRIKPASGLYDYESKYTPGKTVYECPACLPHDLYTAIQESAVRCYGILGCGGAARIDYMVNKEGPWVLELNTIPGMTETSLLPKAAQAAGIGFDDLCERLLNNAGLLKGAVS